MLFRIEIELTRLAPAFNLDIVVFIFTKGNIVCGQIWQSRKNILQLTRNFALLFLQSQHLAFQLSNLGHQSLGCFFVTSPLGLTDRFGRLVATSLAILELGFQRATLLVERQ